MSTLDNALTYKTDAQTAFAAGDYATALIKFELLLNELAFIPDTAQGGDSLTFRRDIIEKQIQRCQKLLNSQQGIQSSKVRICPVATQGVPQVGIW